MTTTQGQRCPTCHTPAVDDAAGCANCGLIFASVAQPTAALATVPLAVSPVARGGRLTPLQPGQILAEGRYTVQRPLKQGGMGSLYLALDHQAFDRPVVLKTLRQYYDPGDAAAAERARRRFIAEAQLLARLRYPTIPQIYTHFAEGSGLIIVMEYIEGQDLAAGLTHYDARGVRVAGKPFRPAQVTQWGIELCRTLEYLAAQTPPVVHHDIKPANLMLDRNSGALFLVDFGTALFDGPPRPSPDAPSVYGTPGYAPPEQFQGRSTPKSDVYALAAALYHLATDDDPADNTFRFPRLKRIGRLGDALKPALAPDPDDRVDAAGLRAQLEAAAAPRSPVMLRARRPHAEAFRLIWTLVGLLTLVLLVLLFANILEMLR